MHKHPVRFLLASLAVIAATALFADRLPRRAGTSGPTETPLGTEKPSSSSAEAPTLAVTGAAGEIMRAADSHFYVDAQVNGARVRMMVDTGASSVVLTRADAQAAGIPAGAEDFTARGMGAGGEIALKPVIIGRIAVGTLAAANVSAMVAQDALPVSLLGQSYLVRVASVEIRGDRMILK